MTAPQQQQPLNCQCNSSCNHFGKQLRRGLHECHSENSVSGTVTDYERKAINKRGCAAHSAASQQRCACDEGEDLCILCPRQPEQQRIEQTIGRLQARIDDTSGECGNEDYYDGCRDAYKSAIALLRGEQHE